MLLTFQNVSLSKVVIRVRTFIVWLAPRAGILCSGGPISRPLEIARFIPVKAKLFGVIFWACNKSCIDQACSRRVASFLFSVFYGSHL